MIVIMYEDFPDQVLPHLCCRNSSGQEWLSAMAHVNPEYRHEILDRTEELISDLELAEKIQKNELDSIRAEERWLWSLQRAD